MLQRLGFWLLGLMAGVGCCGAAIAQSVPSAVTPVVTETMGAGDVGTQIVEDIPTNTFQVTGGDRQQNVLFHSFEDFSPQNANVLFELNNSQSTIDTVISRVTGGSGSVINGELALTGGNRPDFFLINPNGVVFGESARLSVPGSFVVSSAEAFTFGDGQRFSATVPAGVPLLAVSTPIGLQLGSRSADITVAGTGHAFTTSDVSELANSPTGLAVEVGQNLVLVGGNLTLAGGTLRAPSGQISLIAAGERAVSEQANVALRSADGQWQMRPSQPPTAGHINLLQQALVSTSGLLSGSVQLWSGDVTIQDGSLVWVENQGAQAGAAVNVNVHNTLDLIGARPSTGLLSGVYSAATGAGTGAQLNVIADRINLHEGGTVQTFTRNAGDAGAVSINAEEIDFFDSQSDDSFGLIRTRAQGASGNSGALEMNTRSLTIEGAGVISSNSFIGSGNGSNITINASEFISLTGSNENRSSTIITASAVSATGNSGDITINTPRLDLRGGAVISSSVFGAGQGGQIAVNAAERVSLQGGWFSVSRDVFENSSIRTTGILLSPFLRRLAAIPDEVTGNAGDVVINTANLELTDHGEITVRHESVGNAGNLRINADVVRLDQGAQLAASTTLGAGGNIEIESDDLLSLRNGSLLTATAGGLGDGGNIEIVAPVILGFENSDIAADASQGNGGNVNITTQGIIGLAFRDEQTPESDITASSEFGVSGTVEINDLAVDPSVALVELPEAPADVDDQIAATCDLDVRNRFVPSGRGGLPIAPAQVVESSRVWQDTRAIAEMFESSDDVSDDVSDERAGRVEDAGLSATSVPEAASETGALLTEATTWHRNAQGELELAVGPVSADFKTTVGSCLAATVF